ncbi:Metallo-dependent phosphatase-like protein [Dimargaris cristalligena]|uniref:Metallo-dependent phosphatase-like protein n=1 Tax=Dimargaris cristalligena TaxID=215637 RepID=A0A4P9ZMF8_9FUNG|nr:Metallo-dependent phosphatase-like protein [Dimargaris cristalligena]|eukprot:RKP34393.1 Metallo-dependent phosphatase-like protein [Dimargaris cristalligena]
MGPYQNFIYDSDNAHSGELSGPVRFHNLHQTAYQDIYQEGVKLRIIITNDIHAHEDEFNYVGADCTDFDRSAQACFGGAARRRTIVDMLRAGHPDTLLVDAGDAFQGHLIHNYYTGLATAHIMNVLAYSFMTIGNHEFDNGIDALAAFFNQLDFPVVCSNIEFPPESPLHDLVYPYVIIKKYNLGVVGFTTTNIKSLSLGEGLSSITITDPVVAVQKQIDYLQSVGVKTIVAISHSGYRIDQLIAQSTQGLQIIFGGHSHTYLANDPDQPQARGPYPTTVYDRLGHPVYVVQTKKFGEYVGYLDLTLDSDSGAINWLSGQSIHMTQNITPDQAMQDFIRHIRRPIDTLANQYLAELNVDMPQMDCKVGECRLGNLVTEAMLYSARDDPSSSLSPSRNARPYIALINSDVMRSGLTHGPVNLGHVLMVFPNANSLVRLELPGADLRNIMIAAVTQVNPVDNVKSNCFVQFAGIRIEFNFWQKYLGKIEVRSATGVWEPLDDQAIYPILTTDFVALGGDHLVAIKLDFESILPLNQMLARYLANNPKPNIELDGRHREVPVPASISVA